jgi:hypothetical protein
MNMLPASRQRSLGFDFLKLIGIGQASEYLKQIFELGAPC